MATEREDAGIEVLHLEVGQPSTPAPARARRAVVDQLDRSSLGYTNAPGLAALRDRVAQHYVDRYGVAVPSRRVMIVGGASAGFTLAFLASFDAGMRVGVVEPGYPCYRNTLTALGVTPVPIAVDESTRWSPTVELLDAYGPLDGLVVASPSNPTGTVLDVSRLTDIVDWCHRTRVQLIADEIYHGIVYGTPAPSVLELTADAVVVNSFSKYFSMTGWRVGWMVVPDHLAETAERLQQNLYICASHVAQIAALAAFDDRAELDGHVARYQRQRHVLVDGLAAAGITGIAPADGAFYVYANVSRFLAPNSLIETSTDLCGRWLDELNLAATPGVDFDLARGHQFVRFSYAGTEADLAEACARLQRWRP